MAIPESQLEIWSHQGSITQSSRTYNTIKNVLDAATTPYAAKDFNVFLQGSYGNDTNIYAESDVDIVIQLNDCFFHDLSSMTQGEQSAFHAAHPGTALYDHVDFKRDVLKALQDNYKQEVNAGDKAIAVAANGSRRKADVIAAVQFRRYYRFLNISPDGHGYVEGICFFNRAGERIANYPRQHSANLTRKHQASGEWFKPTVRVVKNMRERMKEEKLIAADVAPSYYLEGLLYNVPNEKFGNSYEETVMNALNWLWSADRTDFLCANEQYYLLRENSPVTWRASKCQEFLNAAVKLWNEW